MKPNMLLLPIVIPLLSSLLVLIVPRKARVLTEGISLLAMLANLIITALLFTKDISRVFFGLGFGFEFSLRLYHFSAFILASTAAIGFLTILYSTAFMRGKNCLKQFYAYFLISIAFTNGAVLANNLLAMFFFWEGLLLALFGMIAIGNKEAFKTATKAFIIVGITDLCMMLGIVLTGNIAGTLTISNISLPLQAKACAAFILLMIGAISKAGSMPFHSWIPDAAIDAPLPFMALIPASLEKLLGIYFLTRISLDMFQLSHGSWISVLLMTIGGITIILAVMMALIQKDYKKLLSYHAISQVGYMILGIGTCLPAGIIGGLFHMINNALYKSCLFLTGGAVEKQAGTTDLGKLGGLGSKMPVTFACFTIAAVSISGVWPFNGFFSKELVYDAALERGWIFYLLAVGGSFFTAASFLKLGHAAFLGKLPQEHKNVKEAPFSMLAPMAAIACVCVLFGVFNSLPIRSLIQPVLGEARLEGRNFSGMPANASLVVITFAVLFGALLNHFVGFKKKGSGLHAVDHIHYAPVLSAVYDKAEKRFFDPYDLGLKFASTVSNLAWRADRAIDWLYDSFTVNVTLFVSHQIRKSHSGNYSLYVAWSLVGLIAVILFLIKAG